MIHSRLEQYSTDPLTVKTSYQTYKTVIQKGLSSIVYYLTKKYHLMQLLTLPLPESSQNYTL